MGRVSERVEAVARQGYACSLMRDRAPWLLIPDVASNRAGELVLVVLTAADALVELRD
jgi:hypothetical protein